jgi:folate-binding protein YgfZ
VNVTDTPLAAAAGAGNGAAAEARGRLSRDYLALRQGCAIADRSGLDRMEVLGADRLRFLNAYVTCDVKGLTPGQGTYGFLTSTQGRILADAVILAHADRLWLELPPGQQEPIAGHLRKYLLSDRVEMRPLLDVLPLTLAGPRAATVLAAVAPGCALPAAPWEHARATVLGTEVAVQRTQRLGVPALTLWVPAAAAGPLREKLLAWSSSEDTEDPEDTEGAEGDAGLRAAGDDALEAVRTEAGIPRFGQDFGPQSFPQETGEEQAVSYTKGCYLGQEVVARIHYRGAVQKSLCGLMFDGETVPAPGTALLFEGREAGSIGTAVWSPALESAIGLAILHRRAAAPGSVLQLAGGGAGAEVRALPMVDPAGSAAPAGPGRP